MQEPCKSVFYDLQVLNAAAGEYLIYRTLLCFFFSLHVFFLVWFHGALYIKKKP